MPVVKDTPQVRVSPRSAVVVWVLTWGCSATLLGWYTGGDLVNYRAYWELMGESPGFSDAWDQLYSYLGGSEPGFALIAYLCAGWLSHDAVMNLANATIVTLIFVWLRRSGAPAFFSALVLTNFYLVVLLIPAERLKFAALALLLGTVVGRRARLVAWIMAPLTHLQALLVLVPIAFEVVFGRSTQSRKMSLAKRVGFLIVLGIAAFITYRFTGEGAIVKAESYAESAGGAAWVPSALVLAVLITVFPKRISAIIGAAWFTTAAILLGGDRVNMMTIALMIVVFTQERKFSHPIILLTLCYFTFRAAEFVLRVQATGTGF